jgi:TFIIF-interacting CTD phosphatase-like protein
MSQHYEIIIFTSSMPQYSESIISQLPFVAHKLFRHHCTRLKGRLVKDLLRIGRPLERTIIVDNE